MTGSRSDGLREALDLSPDNHALRLVLADSLRDEGRLTEAAEQYGFLLEAGRLPSDALVRAGRVALDADDLQLAARSLEAALAAGVVDGTKSLRDDLERELGSGGPGPAPELGPDHLPEEYGDGDDLLGEEPRFRPEQVSEGPAKTTFDQVGGLDEVKKTVHRTIILPFQRPELYLKYGRRVGGGVMLYGAPGCGKTLLARATAGECGLPFFNIRIEEVLDPHFGISERNLHDAFEAARASAPCVLFMDELDAIAYARSKQHGSVGRPLVDQLLQELDAIGSDNRDILILAATNAPWDVDDGLKRPGRLDRVLFVPPPDLAARRRILEMLLAERPAEGVDADALAKRTSLFSGADLRALVERALDNVIEEALDTGGEPPLSQRHVDEVLARMRPTTLDWLQSARNYVEFANKAGRYDEVASFLRTKEVKAWRKADKS